MNCWFPFILQLAIILLTTTVSVAQERFEERDTDGDGTIDRIARLDADGTLLQLDGDSNNDGAIDIRQKYINTLVSEIQRDTDHDGFFDRHEHYAGGELQRIDYPGTDGKIGTVDLFTGGHLVTRKQDSSGDGSFDTITRYDNNGEKTLVTVFSDSGGRPAERLHFTGGRLSRIEKDNNHDGRFDLLFFYEDGRLVRQKEDRDGDGSFETLFVFDSLENIQEWRLDENGDNRFDKYHRSL